MTESHVERRDHGGPWDGGIGGLAARYFVLGGMWLGERIPPKLTYGIMTALIRGLAVVKPGTKKVVAENLRSVLGDSMPGLEFKKLVRLNMRYTWAFRQGDMVTVERFDKEYVEKHVRVEGAEHCMRAHEEGNGVLLVGFHFGAPTVGWAAHLPYMGLRVLVPGRRIFDRRASRRLFDASEAHGAKIIFSDFAYPELIAHLESGGTVPLMGDHLTSPRGIRVTYFGRETLMPAGPAIIAYRMRPAVLPYYCVRVADEEFLAVFGDPLDIPPTPEKIEEADLVTVADQYIAFFEDAIRQYPEEWETYFSAWPKSFDDKDLEDFWTAYGVMT